MIRERSVEKRLFALRTAAMVGRNLLFLLGHSTQNGYCQDKASG